MNASAIVKRGDQTPAQQVDAFIAAADDQADPAVHDMLHAAARVIEVMPRYAAPGSIEYIARWLDTAWATCVRPEHLSAAPADRTPKA